MARKAPETDAVARREFYIQYTSGEPVQVLEYRNGTWSEIETLPDQVLLAMGSPEMDEEEDQTGLPRSVPSEMESSYGPEKKAPKPVAVMEIRETVQAKPIPRNHYDLAREATRQLEELEKSPSSLRQRRRGRV